MSKTVIVPFAGPIMEVEFPPPPGVNGLYRNYKHINDDGTESSARASTAKHLRFKKEAVKRLKNAKQDHDLIQMIRVNKEKEKFIPLKLEVLFNYQYLWKVDADSGLKAVQDAVFAYLNVNDTLVTDITLYKRMDAENPRCLVRLSFSQLGGVQW